MCEKLGIRPDDCIGTTDWGKGRRWMVASGGQRVSPGKHFRANQREKGCFFV
jgi:hypothetical protein